MSLPNRVTIKEVGPRDGLQAIQQQLTTEQRVELVDRLSATGLSYIEVGSFVSAKKIPQMAHTDQVLETIKRRTDVTYAALTPNERGFTDACAAKVNEVSVFTAASEDFCQHNIGCSIKESFERFLPVLQQADELNIPVRGYVSCVAGCPYEGEIEPEQVAVVASKLIELGCYEVSLGDTIGVGTAEQIKALIQVVSQTVAHSQIAVHFHDTFGQALTNIYAALQSGISVIDSAIAGLGGCPYAPGASGNVATEDVVYLLDGLGIQTGIDFDALLDVNQWIQTELSLTNYSKVAQALVPTT